MRVLDLEYADPRMNIAIEQAISSAVGSYKSPSTLRFWRNSNSVIIGRNQNVEMEINREACEKYNTKVIRRFTGGGAVYQDLGNLNWAVAITKKELKSEYFDYGFYSKAIIDGIKPLGLCAQFVSPNSIAINGKKISGMAAFLDGNTYFCHGTLLINTNIKILEEVLNAPKMKPLSGFVSSIKTSTTTIQKELKRNVRIDNVKKLIIQGFRNIHGIQFTRGQLSSCEERLARKFYEAKYKLEIT